MKRLGDTDTDSDALICKSRPALGYWLQDNAIYPDLRLRTRMLYTELF